MYDKRLGGKRMALLQVRNFPEDKYKQIAKLAKEQRRSIAQQAVLLIDKGLSDSESAKERRIRALERTLSRPTPDGLKGVDFAAMIREDRDR